MNKNYGRTVHYLTMPLKYDKSYPFSDIEIIHKGNDRKIYKNATIMTPGEWSDSITNAPVVWLKSKLMAYSNNWFSNYINLGHQHGPLDFVGSVNNQRWHNNAIVGDFCIHTNTTKGKDIVTNIENGLIKYLSVEVGTNDYWDRDLQKRCADEIVFLGVSIVGPFPGPACKDAKIN